ncbi:MULTISPECIES: hypothetical protein [unclassified Nocardioides]|uniref:hypothetical protein n=1 Tax=unclassified Nocardioides TaxID=2615069 RepID=UPI000700EF49|nr:MULTISPECIES: hypothetical protein [unclassified Nocardioides]KRA38982.1 hypothetical protein ASD81_10490 [Nocardioides sp. Root614]KRA92941.1 hypothetical protein ASD84_10755 [Nocardioides sp. Root682]
MTPIKRPLAAAGAVVLLALSLSACGGGAPTDASKDDYCKAVGDAGSEEFGKAITDKDYDKAVDLIKESADKIEEVGTPDDISDEEREGFEIQLDAVKSLDGDDLKKAFEAEDGEDPFEADLSKDEKEKVEAYNKYENETCSDTDDGSDQGSDDGADEGSDPSIDPSDLPSDVPTGLPSDISPEDLESLQEELENLTESANQ